ITKGVSLLCAQYDALQMCNVTRAHCDDYNMYFISCFDQEPELTDFVDFQVHEFDLRHYALAHGILKIDVPDKTSYDDFFICSTGWSISEAKVACRQQGFDPKDAAIDTFSKYPCYDDYDYDDVKNRTPSINIYMSDVVCNGDEYNLADCSFNYGENASCPDATRASVICGEIKVRLKRRKTANSGLVEIYVGYTWRKVCSSTLGMNEAKVICQQLGLPYGNVSTYERKVPITGRNDLSFIDDLQCTGNEHHIGQCNFNYGNNDLSELNYPI
ncbi:unnamed protein product, partial [Owenia fusiformis]